MKEVEKLWEEEFERENAGKSIKRISKIIKKCQKTEEINQKQKKLLERKYEEFLKFAKGESENFLKAKIFE